MINKYIYAAIGSGTNAANEAVMLPAKNLTGIDINTDDETYLFFQKVSAAFATDVSTISLRHNTGLCREVMEQISAALCSNPKDGFIPLADVDKDGHGRFFSETGRNFINDAGIAL